MHIIILCLCVFMLLVSISRFKTQSFPIFSLVSLMIVAIAFPLLRMSKSCIFFDLLCNKQYRWQLPVLCVGFLAFLSLFLLYVIRERAKRQLRELRKKAMKDFKQAWLQDIQGQTRLDKLDELKGLCIDIRQRNIDAERNRTDETHTNRLFHWLNMRARENLFTKDGKRLQRENNLDELFKDAQALNKPVHEQIKSIMSRCGTRSKFDFEPGPIKRPQRAIEKIVRRYHRQPRYLTDIVRCRVYVEDIQSIDQFVQDLRSDGMLNICFLKNRIDDEYDAKQTFGFRDLQLNLEAGWSNGNIVPKKDWDLNTRKHVCEVQVMLRSFRKVIENSDFGLKWENVGTAKPTLGRELQNDKLTAVLQQKTELDATEWKNCGINDLRHDDFIKAGDSYFKPSDSRYETLRDLAGT